MYIFSSGRVEGPAVATPLTNIQLDKSRLNEALNRTRGWCGVEAAIVAPHHWDP